jgi:hypothetical protein
MACAAADIQNTFAISGSDELEKGQGQAPAPTAHVQLIPFPIRCNECRGGIHDRSPFGAPDALIMARPANLFRNA